jgi:HEAT repeat protein
LLTRSDDVEKPHADSSLPGDRDPAERMRAAQVLGLIGPEAKAAAPARVDGLLDPEARVRVRAAEALWQVARDPAGIAILAEVLRNDDLATGDRVGAAHVLGRIGPPAWAARLILTELTKAGVFLLRSTAADALQKVDPEAAREAGVWPMR